MLKYIWQVPQDLFLTVTFATLIHAVLFRTVGVKGKRIHWYGIGFGILSATIFSYVRNTTSLIITSYWHHYLYLVILVFTLLFALFSLICGKRRDAGLTAATAVYSLSGAVLSAAWIFFRLPTVLFYPFNFNTMGNGYLSWYYFQRLLGWLIALLILVIYARLLYLCALEIKKQAVPLFALNIGTIANAVYCAGYFFVPWVNRAKWLHAIVKYDREKFPWARRLVMFTATHAMLFIWITAASAAGLMILFFIENLKVTEAYENSAQHRKLRAINRRHRREAAAAMFFLAAIVVSLTVVKAYDTRVVELSAPETYTVEGDEILIPIEMVSDGHLHRFEYKTEKNINVRWIVVKKPGSASFGVGLDACEVCGDAGYFERNGQVICKRCDVVMNINTIGFKGGCNPIPLAYAVRDGNLVFALEDIIAGEREFR